MNINQNTSTNITTRITTSNVLASSITYIDAQITKTYYNLEVIRGLGITQGINKQ